MDPAVLEIGPLFLDFVDDDVVPPPPPFFVVVFLLLLPPSNTLYVSYNTYLASLI